MIAGERAGTAPESDEQLVSRIAGGDREAFAALYDRYAPVLLALAQRMLHNDGEAEDLVHDVCLEVWRQAHTYEPSRGPARVWLIVRLRSRALDRLRSAGHARIVAADTGSTSAHERRFEGEELELGCDHARVRRAVASLPEEQRAVLELAYFEGLSMVEIGERLSIPVGTVKSRLSRALERLRADLLPAPKNAAI